MLFSPYALCQEVRERRETILEIPHLHGAARVGSLFKKKGFWPVLSCLRIVGGGSRGGVTVCNVIVQIVPK